MIKKLTAPKSLLAILATLLLGISPAFAGEADLVVPSIKDISLDSYNLLIIGMVISVIGLIFGFIEFLRIKKLDVHHAMAEVGNTIFETCKTYLIQQGKFLLVLEVLIGLCIAFYFGYLQKMGISGVLTILAWSVIGILGSYAVAWFGIRMNTLANARTAFVSLKGRPLDILNIPLKAGMSIGVLLVSVELILMLTILLFVPGHLAGACFIGFAIGESLGASALRVAGGIFTKIADIGSDLMKIQFGIKEDDPRNPGVIADCTGDNAGDSVGPTADGFETYGVTGVALVSFILLAVIGQENQVQLLTWIFVMRFLMIVTSVVAYWINGIVDRIYAKKAEKFDFEQPLTNLVWLTSILSIAMTFGVSHWLLSPLGGKLWLVLSVIISCGTLGAALIPEFTKIFTSPKAKHTAEVVTASKEGGASLTILSGIVAGNFSAFWIGMVIVLLMALAYVASLHIPASTMIYPSVFAFGLVAFGFLGMGPVTIAVDSYGPVTDNAQSVYELSLIEEIPNVAEEIENDYGFKPDFENAKQFLEENDGAGNTFKATSKPVLIGTAVVGATTMIFSLILVIQNTLGIRPEEILNMLNPYTLLGLLTGGAVIYWFSGASMQAVTTGAYRAVEYIKENIKLDDADSKSANVSNSKEVVKICTQYAQKGMINIFIALFTFALSLACLSAPTSSTSAPVAFFVSYLIAIAVFGLFQAVFMANAGGCWDNAKKIVEVDMKEKGTPLHEATVVGDTVGDPFKDTSSVAMNPIIKFTTLFGLLAMEIAISEAFRDIAPVAGWVFLVIALIFVIRSFYGMRIPSNK
ncbi:TPA: sodium-translocating pyrophosphatase [Candidatus Scatousia excrementigallinarum]|uniref:K(+)-insensitive pyrophosphate-energized proton pump n=1 Tax=Candidatus Scatousia excrementigallinarum TaxID=2840935 RepID=A0A9D1F038_9BACT|nr:sodium-translocating pyrophosphatase [Candidatus Scatousia excrementigallinarum]